MTNLVLSSPGGNYRINDDIFPVPNTSWQELPVAAGLNGISINSSYRRHLWSWDRLDSYWANLLYDLFETQQDNNSQLTTLETDPYDASLAQETYGTQTYTDFVIISVSNRTRGLPTYDDVSVVFEVYVA